MLEVDKLAVPRPTRPITGQLGGKVCSLVRLDVVKDKVSSGELECGNVATLGRIARRPESLGPGQDRNAAALDIDDPQQKLVGRVQGTTWNAGKNERASVG